MRQQIVGVKGTEHGQSTPDATIDAWVDRLAQSAPDWMEDRRPSLIVIADNATRPQFAALADAVGARCLAHVTPAQGASHLARMAAVDVIVLDALDAVSLDSVLPHVMGMIVDGDSRLILASSPKTLDASFEALAQYGLIDAPVQWLCAPTPTDWVTALTLACNAERRPLALHDIGRESDAARLERLSEEVERLARALDMMGTEANRSLGNGAAPRDGTVRDPEGDAGSARAPNWPLGAPQQPTLDAEDRMTAHTVRDLLRYRRLRDQFFGGDLFGDPAWDMMLDLMAARLAGERVSVSSLCIASAVPPTTALRWIRDLTERGIFERRPDPMDGRRVFIRLSDEAAEAMQRWYAAGRRARRELSN